MWHRDAGDRAGRPALPAGFRYSIVFRAGSTKLDSGEFTPRNHDGTGAFAGRRGATVLVNNHEIREPFGTALPVPHLDRLTYDPGAAGGRTIVEVDGSGRRRGETRSRFATGDAPIRGVIDRRAGRRSAM